MKKLFLCFIFILLLKAAAPVFSQQTFYFGIAGGAGIPILDFNKEAVFQYEVVRNFSNNPQVTFNPQSETAPSINTSLYFGLEANKYFGVRLGADFYFLVNETAPIDFYQIVSNKTSYYFKGTINYQYNLVNIPALAQVYFVNGNVFRLGIEAGPFFGFTLGGVERTVEGTSDDASIVAPGPETLDPIFTMGLQAGLISEFKIGRGALTFNIDFARDLYTSIETVMPEIMQNPEAIVTIPDGTAEKKLTIFQAVKVSLGYKFNIQLSGPPSSTGEAIIADDSNANYYIIVGAQAEGPLKISDLQGLHKRGILKADTMLWKTGMDNWTEAADFAELFTLFR